MSFRVRLVAEARYYQLAEIDTRLITDLSSVFLAYKGVIVIYIVVDLTGVKDVFIIDVIKKKIPKRA